MTREEIEHFIARLKLATVDEYNEIITALWLNDEQQREEIRLLREAIDLAMSSRAVVMDRVEAFTILSHFHAKLGSDYCRQRDEARQEIELLSEQVHAANKELLERADALESSLYCYRLLAHAYELNAREIARLRTALMELHAVVKGECPRLLNEDSGGDAKLAMEIEALIQETP